MLNRMKQILYITVYCLEFVHFGPITESVLHYSPNPDKQHHQIHCAQYPPYSQPGQVFQILLLVLLGSGIGCLLQDRLNSKYKL